MLACTCGMLLCLDREQRLAYILGAILDVSDSVAAEVLEITSESFRQRLARTRRDLRNFVDDMRPGEISRILARAQGRYRVQVRQATEIERGFEARG